MSSAKKDNYFTNRKYTGINQEEEEETRKRPESAGSFYATESNWKAVFGEEETRNDVNWEKQSLLVGNRAKQQFWHLYKSERVFKDYNPDAKQEDPRLAYF